MYTLMSSWHSFCTVGSNLVCLTEANQLDHINSGFFHICVSCRNVAFVLVNYFIGVIFLIFIIAVLSQPPEVRYMETQTVIMTNYNKSPIEVCNLSYSVSSLPPITCAFALYC